MKTKNFILFFGLIMVLFSCQKRDWNNPFDPDCPKESFTPSNFKAEQQGNLVKLSWSQANTHISGFKVERKVGDGSWAEVAPLGKSIITWNDVNLTGGKLHEYRLYAYAGNNLSNKVTTQITPLFVATLTTTAISSVTSSSASGGGTISSDGGAPVTARGVCWGTLQNPTITGSKTIDGTGIGTFTSTITGLTAGTTYYVRAYATNSVGTAYGSQISFTTSPVLSLATVTTDAVTTFTSTTALLGGNVTSDGNATVTERGVCYSTFQNPTTANNKTAIGSGTGTFSTTVTGLTANTTYFVRAYAINSQGTAYGSQVSFTTSPVLSLATVTTASVSTYTSTTALLGGNVTSDGNATVIERGVCYATTQNPTTANNKTIIGSGTGTFSATVAGLTSNTSYYVRAYAINSQGTVYGSQVSFTTSLVISLASVTTATVSTYTSNTALLGGNVTSDGNATVTERGVCYSTSQNPTTADNKTVIGNGNGTFSTTVSGLTANTSYYVRAYALNSQGTAYGSQVSFTTSQVLSLPIVTTSTVTTYTSTTALLGGNVTNDGNTTVTERGVCYAINQNPTTSDSKTVIGSGIGVFSTTITGLTSNITYYVRAYAINSQGTAYGSQVSFTTSAMISFPAVTTSTVTTYTSTTALLGGNVTNDGNTTVTERGVCYAINQNPTTSDSKTVIGSGTGIFSTTITGLTSNTTFYVRAYAINSQGTAYGSQVSFTTSPVLSLPTVITAAVNTFTSNIALLGGNVTSDGNATVTERGVCYATTQNPTTSNNKTAVGSGSGTFSTSVGGLTANTIYYVRAYAINSQGTTYGVQVSFTTSPVISLPILTTSAVATYTSTTAVFGGNVTSDGNSTVTERGVCYATTQNPTTANNNTVIGSGTGTFSTTVIGLTSNTTYYVRAYAINSQGTAYGQQENFITDFQNCGTVIDADGNTYKTVLIGTQCWMAENLKTTKWKDGSVIQNITNNYDWAILNYGAYCWNNNYINNKNIYGALYNWYAVKTEKLCPTGWHVPTDDEWSTLSSYLGVNAGGKMKETGILHWLSPNTNATNESGFSALPGGSRSDQGTFSSDNNYGIWWSATELYISGQWFRVLHNDTGEIDRSIGNRNNWGFSVRCVIN